MEKKNRILEILPNFLLFFLFASCMFLVLLCGAKAYRNISGVMEEQFSVNTCVNYVTAKVRHYDTVDAVSTGSIDGVDALILEEKIHGEAYLTYLYCSDGNLMEMFCEADLEFLPADGQTIMPLDALSIKMENGLLFVSCEEAGEQAEAVVFLQSGRRLAE